MVAQNKNGGANSDGWWDDLPPAVRRRVSRPTPSADDRPQQAPETYRPAVVSDLSRLAMLFLAVAVANLLFLLVALSFLSGTGPLLR